MTKTMDDFTVAEASRPTDNTNDSTTIMADVVVIGTGISGLFTALKLAEEGLRPLLITKSSLDESNSRYAQGGIAAVLPQNTEDSIEQHAQDTLNAGAGLCDTSAVNSILAEGYPAIEDLLHYGVPFDRNADKSLALTREAAHSVDRILHIGGDATGHSVEMTLIQRVKEHPSIRVMEHTQVVELSTQATPQGRQCSGCVVADLRKEQVFTCNASHVVLATGGVGRLYSHTTNPAIATGDGFSLAYQAGATLCDIEFVQFHPTAFYSAEDHAPGPKFLISEALRGEGGILLNAAGHEFAQDYHPDAELAPRDVVTRAIFDQMCQQGVPHVYLSIAHLPAETIEQRFPTILDNCLAYSVDIRTDRIPVSPAAHYMMGGVQVDLNGQTSVEHLWCVGETAQTGLHGANRLASNSLLECVVLARRVASSIAATAPVPTQTSVSASPTTDHYSWQKSPLLLPRIAHLRQMMWQHVGILRDASGLSAVIQQLDMALAESKNNQWSQNLPVGKAYHDQLVLALVIAEAALLREESVGAHTRLDFPKTDDSPQHSYQSLTQNLVLPCVMG